tara:strand:+ start:396 stop:683 length:288 start_codon:yes stop_codon:yes gene_type:complete
MIRNTFKRLLNKKRTLADLIEISESKYDNYLKFYKLDDVILGEDSITSKKQDAIIKDLKKLKGVSIKVCPYNESTMVFIKAGEDLIKAYLRSKEL